jgi:hypothetical protein
VLTLAEGTLSTRAEPRDSQAAPPPPSRT